MNHTKKHQSGSRALSAIFLLIAVIEPLLTIPQIYKIWSSHNASSISTISWTGYVVASAVWLAYSLKIRDKPLIISSTLWVVAESLVLIGALRFMSHG